MTSQINPTNINGAYPVAGQDNNSQGFRDNFTNTVNNFQFAAAEISDLQSKAVVNTQLVGGQLLSVQNNMLNSPLTNALVADFAYTTVSLGTLTTAVTIDYSAGHYQSVTLGSSVTLSFIDWPLAGQTGVVTVSITVTSTANTVTLPANVTLGTTGIQGLSGGVLTFAQTGTYSFQFSTANGGASIMIQDLNRPLSYYTNNVTMLGNLTVGGTITGTNSNSPLLLATQSTPQTLTVSGTPATITLICDTASEDSNSNYNTSTGIYTPNKPGWYQVNGAVNFVASGTLAGAYGMLELIRTTSGVPSTLAVGGNAVPSNGGLTSSVSTLVYLDGVGSTIKLAVAYVNPSATFTTSPVLATFFQACWLRD